MSKYQLQQEPPEELACDGFGTTRSVDGGDVVKVWIRVRKDSQIPEFDAVTELKFYVEGFGGYQVCHSKLAEMCNEMGGMFIDDLQKLRDRDVFAMAGVVVAPQDVYPIPLLKALKKAVIDYFRKTGQLERLKKATEEVVCNCRHVTNHDIEEAVEKGYTTVEQVQMATGAGTGCSSCQVKLVALVAGPRRTFMGKLK